MPTRSIIAEALEAAFHTLDKAAKTAEIVGEDIPGEVYDILIAILRLQRDDRNLPRPPQDDRTKIAGYGYKAPSTAMRWCDDKLTITIK